MRHGQEYTPIGGFSVTLTGPVGVSQGSCRGTRRPALPNPGSASWSCKPEFEIPHGLRLPQRDLALRQFDAAGSPRTRRRGASTAPAMRVVSEESPGAPARAGSDRHVPGGVPPGLGGPPRRPRGTGRLLVRGGACQGLGGPEPDRPPVAEALSAGASHAARDVKDEG